LLQKACRRFGSRDGALGYNQVPSRIRLAADGTTTICVTLVLPVFSDDLVAVSLAGQEIRTTV